MNRLRKICALATFAAGCAAGTLSHASFHLWDIKEIFSNHDGTVQFVELFTTSPNEFLLDGHTLQATSDGVIKTFTLNHAVNNPTTNKHLLFATAGFADLIGGVAPDYTALPANFFNPNAVSITINFAGADSLTFNGALLPADGVNSLHDHNPSGTPHLVNEVNSPTNYAGASGSVNLPTPSLAADFNGDGSVNAADLAAWKGGFGAAGAATKAVGNADADADVDGADFLIWQTEFGASSAAAAIHAIPEPTAAFLAALAAGSVAGVYRRRSPQLR